jgi:hypothetical protein
LYEAFAPDKASRLVKRFEWRYTPKRGSWLNRTEFELAALASQCLSRRIADRQKLKAEIAASEVDVTHATPTPVCSSRPMRLALD